VEKVVGVCGEYRELGRVREKSCEWVVGMWFGIRRTKTTEGGQERKEKLRIDGCPEVAWLLS
jgi:hypothetical protein